MSEENGQAPTPPSDMQLVEALAQFTAERLLQCMPGLADNVVADLALLAAHEQLRIDREIFPTFFDERAKSHPTLVMGIFRSNAAELGATVKATKLIDTDVEVGSAVHTAMVHAILSTPYVRAMLRACGFAYTFAQSAEQPQSARRIIM